MGILPMQMSKLQVSPLEISGMGERKGSASQGSALPHYPGWIIDPLRGIKKRPISSQRGERLRVERVPQEIAWITSVPEVTKGMADHSTLVATRWSPPISNVNDLGMSLAPRSNVTVAAVQRSEKRRVECGTSSIFAELEKFASSFCPSR